MPMYPCHRISGGGQAVDIPYITTQLTTSGVNDSFSTSISNYNIPVTGCYMVIAVTAANNRSNLSMYNGPTGTLNSDSLTFTTVVNDAEEYENIGFRIDICIFNATQNDKLSASTSGQSGQDMSTYIMVSRFLFGDFTKVTTIYDSVPIMGTSVAFNIDIDGNDYSDKSCIGIMFIRGNNNSGFRDITVSQVNKSDTKTDAPTALYSPSDTTWRVRSRFFYPQINPKELMNVQSASLGSNQYGKFVILQFE